ncbi:MAG: trigger factor [Candidatus Omnitrophota bacterium]
MKVKVESPKSCFKVLKIEIPKEKVMDELEGILAEIKRTAAIPGFRPGKASKDIVRSHYLPAAQQRLLERLVPLAYEEAVVSENISPIGLPGISEVCFKPDSPLSFTASVTVSPEFTLKNYKGIRIKKKENDFKEEEIDKTLSVLQEKHAQYHAVEDRKVAWNDYIICDLEYFILGKSIDKKENILIKIAEDSYITGFAAQLVDTAINEARKFSLKIPDDFPNIDQAGKIADFVVQVKEIKIKKLPELSDDFAKDFGQDTLTGLKAVIKQGILEQKEIEIKHDINRQIIDNLVKSNNFDLPDSLVEKQTKSIFEQKGQYLLNQGFKPEDIAKQKEILEQHARTTAERQVKSFFILNNIAELENIIVSDEDINKRIELLAQSYYKTPEEMHKYLEEKKMMSEFVWELKEAKITDFLVSHAVISEEK